MTETAPNINRYWADLIIAELIRCGVTTFAVAPGSRSSPLVTALAAHPDPDCIIHFDERGTSFFALGAGLKSRVPAVWITTSGTAVANGFPAVVEASQSHVPLILLTADRPFELRDVGANQAIDQVRIFGSYPRWSIDLPTPDPLIPPSAVLTAVDQAFIRASGPPAGPVHVNVPFREPLAPSRYPFEVNEEDIARWRSSNRPYTTGTHGNVVPEAEQLRDIRTDVEKAERGLIVVGGLPTQSDSDAVMSLAERYSWPVLADITSQTRLGGISELVMPSPHFLVGMPKAERPDVIFRFGGRISSKAVAEYVEGANPKVFGVVSDTLDRNDPSHVATHRIHADPTSFVAVAKGWAAGNNQDWNLGWRQSDVFDETFRFLTDPGQPVSEPGVARGITQLIPEDMLLFLASSMPVRDVDMFADPSGNRCWIGSNRGASGIDGTIASAAGAGRSAGRRATTLIGDLALLYDLNSLALLSDRSDIVIVLNNDGGGIFSFLPIHEYPDVFETWFGTPHGYGFRAAGEMFGLHYESPGTMGDFSQAYQEGLARSGSTLIEIRVRRDENLELHRRLEADLRDSLK